MALTESITYPSSLPCCRTVYVLCKSSTISFTFSGEEEGMFTSSTRSITIIHTNTFSGPPSVAHVKLTLDPFVVLELLTTAFTLDSGETTGMQKTCLYNYLCVNNFKKKTSKLRALTINCSHAGIHHNAIARSSAHIRAIVIKENQRIKCKYTRITIIYNCCRTKNTS